MKKRERRLIVIACLLIGLLPSLSLAVQDKAEPGAKALFYDPQSGDVIRPTSLNRITRIGGVKIKGPKPVQTRNVGIRCWVELDGVGNVTTDRIFHTGEAIRLRVRSNADGYLSLWTIDSAGRGKPLFPAPDQPQSDNRIKAGIDYVTPSKIRFVLPVEDERLLVFFSRSPIDLPVFGESRDGNEIIAQAQSSIGSKALVSETEYKRTAEIGSYTVNKNGGLIIQEIRLKHQ
ncbi:MAG TPA: DUF4384 domain-containing protein [Blastocatellia bacterium]|jgi:hypothetical protein